jgi:hypothetical protein
MKAASPLRWGTGVLIDICGWGVIGICLLAVVGQVVELRRIYHPRPPRGRHSADETEPQDPAREWQRLRLIMTVALLGPAIFLLKTTNSHGLTSDPLRWLAAVAAAIIVIWEIRSWSRIKDPADRRRMLSSARMGFVPSLAQITIMLGVWTDGPARIVIGVLVAVIVIGPDIESWVRRWLIGRASGSTPS